MKSRWVKEEGRRREYMEKHVGRVLSVCDTKVTTVPGLWEKPRVVGGRSSDLYDLLNQAADFL